MWRPREQDSPPRAISTKAGGACSGQPSLPWDKSPAMIHHHDPFLMTPPRHPLPDYPQYPSHDPITSDIWTGGQKPLSSSSIHSCHLAIPTLANQPSPMWGRPLHHPHFGDAVLEKNFTEAGNIVAHPPTPSPPHKWMMWSESSPICVTPRLLVDMVCFSPHSRKGVQEAQRSKIYSRSPGHQQLSHHLSH
jgi:hypothetical protein